MEIQNKEIRELLKEAKKIGIHNYLVAKQIGVNDATFSRYLRFEMAEELKNRIIAAVRICKENLGEK